VTSSKKFRFSFTFQCCMFQTQVMHSTVDCSIFIKHSCLLFIHFYLLTYLVTPQRIVLLEKPAGSQVVKEFPTCYGTLRFITAFTSARHLSLSWIRSIQSMPCIPLPEYPSLFYPPIYNWVLRVVILPQISPPKPCIHLLSTPYVLHDLPISFFSMWSSD
jgi:hypothetical protein